MSEPESADGGDAAVLVSELLEAAMEVQPRSVFEQRALIERALVAIRRMRAGQDFDPVFDADHGALHKVVAVHHAISSAPDHHIRAAMLIAAELLDMLQPSPPLSVHSRKRCGNAVTIRSNGKRLTDDRPAATFYNRHIWSGKGPASNCSSGPSPAALSRSTARPA